MNRLFYYSLIYVWYLLLLNGIECQRKKQSTLRLDQNTCDNRTVDLALHRLLTNKFPVNQRELRIFCNQGHKSLGFAKTYIKNCLPEFPKKVVSVVLFPITNELNLICKSGKPSGKARELMIAANCGNAARPGLARCYHNFVDSELAIQRVQDHRLRIPMICCQYNLVRECFKNEAEEVKVCTRRTIDYVERWALEIFGEIIDIMCYEYPESSDRCDKVLKQIPNIDLKGVTKPKSFLSPLIDIFSDLGEGDTKKVK